MEILRIALIVACVSIVGCTTASRALTGLGPEPGQVRKCDASERWALENVLSHVSEDGSVHVFGRVVQAAAPTARAEVRVFATAERFVDGKVVPTDDGLMYVETTAEGLFSGFAVWRATGLFLLIEDRETGRFASTMLKSPEELCVIAKF